MERKFIPNPAGTADLYRQANEILLSNGCDIYGRSLKNKEASRQAAFEKWVIWHLPFRGASRPNNN